MAKNAWGKYAKKAARKANRGVFAIGILFLLIGFAIGYFGASILGQNDCFVLNGEKEIVITQESAYTYQEQGAKVISLGRDLSDRVVIETDLVTWTDGMYAIDTSREGVYSITYTIDDIRYGHIKRIRTIKVVNE